MFKSLILFIFLAGCTTESVGVTHLSTVETRARGVGLNHSGRWAQLGMFENTCEVQTSTGFIGMDTDVSVGQEDKVEDTSGSLALVIGASGDGVHILDRTDYSNVIIHTGSVDEARFTDSGVVIFSDCNLEWISDGSSLGTVGVPCGEGLTVDSSTGETYIGSAEGILMVSPNGQIQNTGLDGSLLSFDASSGVLYSANLGGSIISGLRDGNLLWSTDLGQPISSLDNMGDRGMVAVMVGNSEAGAVIMLDGATGSIQTTFATPSVADGITVSGNGSVFAISLQDEVHFYNVE